MRILNLYAGIGGNRKLWGDEHEVTAVENVDYIADAYATLFPQDTLIREDAHQYLLAHFQEFDFIWSSPPCPSHSRIRLTHKTKSTKPVYPDMKLYEEIIFLQHYYKGNWAIENVIPFYKPLILPTAELDRHLFWSNRFILQSQHQRKYAVDLTRQRKSTEILTNAYGITLPLTTKNQRKLLRNAVDPIVGLHVFNQVALQKTDKNLVKQEILF
jgi:DNA (cytosine-5)-methyltransferase 1